MNADSSAPQGVLDAQLSQEILALYREARSGLDTDFKHAAMARARRLLPISASTWANGVLGADGPVILEASSIDLKPGFWEAMAPFMASGQDPLGPMMYAAPGRSFITLPDIWPQAFLDKVHKPFDVHSSLTGLSLDPHTGIFSAVCWHRHDRLAPFTEAERLIHEQLLPHWLEGLALHRVLSAARAAELVWKPGQAIAVVDRTGLIHHAQAGFGELLKEELPDWRGAALPAALVDALHRRGGFEGTVVRAAWRATASDGAGLPSARPASGLMLPPSSLRSLPPEGASPPWERPGSGLMLVEMSHRHTATTAVIARDLRSSVLDASLHDAERQLGMVSGALAEQQRRQAIADERQRIMRELHDGVGSHLVGLLNLAHSGTLEPAAMEEALREALDEMRMAVDSMQSSELTVITALANLRYRLQPRFDAAGIRIQWELPAEDAVPPMAPPDVFQWQRILLEAFTNVLKHSRATTTRVVARALVQGGCMGVDVAIVDDGVGMGDGQGQGSRNMRHRARAIGARLAFERNEPGGTAVKLWWPAKATQAADDSAATGDAAAASAWRQPGTGTDSDFGRFA